MGAADPLLSRLPVPSLRKISTSCKIQERLKNRYGLDS